MLLAINPATIVVLPVVASGCYLLYKLWAPQRDEGDAPAIEVVSERQTGVAGFGGPDLGSLSVTYGQSTSGAHSGDTPITATDLGVLTLTEAVNHSGEQEIEQVASHSDFTLDGLFVENSSLTDEPSARAQEIHPRADEVGLPGNTAPATLDEETAHDRAESGNKKRRRSRNSLARFPFDIRVWEDPGTPRSVARAQRKAERVESRAQLEETRVAVTDAVADGGGSVVLASPVEIPREMFADVWQLASGETAPDALVDAEPTDDKLSKRAAKRAEREERKLERLRSKEEKKRQREPVSESGLSFMETEDPWIEGSGEGAFLAAPEETGAPMAWISDEEQPLPETWEIGGAGESMGEASITWAEAAAAAGPVVPSATMISGDELLDLGSSIVIGTEPGAGDGAFYLPEGFDTVEQPETRRRILGRRRRNDDTEDGDIESVSDWAQGGVVLDPDEGVNYQEYDIPEPIPSRTVVIFGESEES